MNLKRFVPSWLQRSIAWLASITVEVNDTAPGWQRIHGGAGPVDRDWAELYQDQADALEAWRRNFLIRQIVRLTTAFVVGDEIRLTSKVPQVQKFLTEFIDHPENKFLNRLAEWCNELTRSGELFPILHTNKNTGVSHIRITPACQITWIETSDQDYEKELEFHEAVPGQLKPRKWKSHRTARVFARRDDNRTRRPEPMMLHYAINKPIGATRGEGDLTPILPWAKRYSEWLKDRVRFNRLRSKMAGVQIKIRDDSQVENKREFYRTNPPTDGAITVTGPNEEITYPAANIQGYDAQPDGQAIRLATAAGANIPLHFLSEGSSATRSTASEMNDPTNRHYRMRQKEFLGFVVDLSEKAWRRYEEINKFTPIDDPGITATGPDISRTDNKDLAEAAKTVVEAFAMMKEQGWIDDERAIRLAFKFAGEVLEEDEINEILASGGSTDAESE